MKKKVFFFLIFSTVFAVGFFAGKKSEIANTQAERNSFREVRQYTNMQKLINPLLECESANFTTYTPYEKEIRTRMESEVIARHPDDKFSVYFRNLNNGPWFGINEEESFYPASLLKVPVMMAYLKTAESNPDILKQELAYTASSVDLVQQMKPENPIELGTVYSVEELLRRMIEFSDNEASALLIKHLPPENLQRAYSDLGVPNPKEKTGKYSLGTKDYASFFRILYNAAYLSQEKSEWALQLLVSTKFQDGLVAGVPQGTIVSHKFGERKVDGDKGTQLHDCGIVYHPKFPYILCVMTKGNDFDKLAEEIAAISKITYEVIEKKN